MSKYVVNFTLLRYGIMFVSMNNLIVETDDITKYIKDIQDKAEEDEILIGASFRVLLPGDVENEPD